MINNNNNLTDIGSISATTYYGDASNLTGISGATGSSGTSGANGSSGSSGANGASGSSGTSGANGATGANGSSGSSGASGATGSSGSSGTSGAQGEAAGLPYNFITSGTNADPGSGNIKFISSGTLSSVGNVLINNTDIQSIIQTSLITTWNTGFLILKSASNSGTNYAVFAITSVVVNTNYVSLTVNITPTTGNWLLSSADSIVVNFTRNGSSGTSGANGSSGTSGANGASGTSGSSGASGANGISQTAAGSFGITVDGGGSTITTGVKGYVEIPYSGTITSWTITSDQSGSCVIDVWKDTYANYPPTIADTIAGSQKPTLSSAVKNQNNALSAWTTSVNAGDFIGFNVDSASAVTKVNLSIKINKS
jgi:hypothetical protein